MEDCTRFDCANRDKCCYKCYNHAFYKAPKQKKTLGSNARKKEVGLNEEDSWKGLESEVARDISKIPSYYDARRQLMSGALWFKPGDIDDNIVHLECKERKGNELESKGTKSFTIELAWLEKGEEEAEYVKKPFFLPFRFKGNPVIRIVTQWKYIQELIVTVKSLMMENDKNQKIIAHLMKALKEAQVEVDISEEDTTT